MMPRSSAPGVMVMAIVFMCHVVTITNIFAATSESPAIRLEREALLKSGWWSNRTANNNSDHCNWNSTICNQAGSITWISLNRSGIEEELRQFNFSCFPNLEHFSIYFNYISGSIPSQIGGLSKLSFLDLGRNNLTGAIPPEIGNLRNLTVLCLAGNQLTGHIPPTLGHMKKLEVLYLNGNKLTGHIPPTLGHMKKLEVLVLSSNNLMGSIPLTLCHLKKMETLYVEFNQLSGLLPQEVGNLTNLTSLSLAANNLSGPLPSTLGHLSKLEYLNLKSNQLSGPLPRELGNLTNLIFLSASHNNLIGPIPNDLTQLSNLQTLNLSSNLLSGQIPFMTSGKGFFNLLYLDLSGNKLSGPISSEIINCFRLEELRLSNNSLSGRIPLEIGKLQSLDHLDLSYNFLNGEIKGDFLKRFYIGAFIGNKDLCSDESTALPPCMRTPALPVLPHVAVLRKHPKSDIHLIRIFLSTTIFFVVFACLHAYPKSQPSMLRVSQEFLACKSPVSKPFQEISIAQLRDYGASLTDEGYV